MEVQSVYSGRRSACSTPLSLRARRNVYTRAGHTHSCCGRCTSNAGYDVDGKVLTSGTRRSVRCSGFQRGTDRARRVLGVLGWSWVDGEQRNGQSRVERMACDRDRRMARQMLVYGDPAVWDTVRICTKAPTVLVLPDLNSAGDKFGLVRSVRPADVAACR